MDEGFHILLSQRQTELSSGAGGITKSDCNIRLRQHGHTHPLFAMPGSATQGKVRGVQLTCISFSWAGCARKQKALWKRQTDPIRWDRGWPDCHETRACRKIIDNSFFLCLILYLLEEPLLLNSLYIHLFIFFPRSCQTTLIFSHFNLGRISKPTLPGEKPGLQGNDLSWMSYLILLRHKEFVCLAYESRGRDGTEG